MTATGLFRDLNDGDILQNGDQYLHENGQWYPTIIVNSRVTTGLTIKRYRRPVFESGPQHQVQFLQAAVTSLESDSLKRILEKEDEHIAVIEANNLGRDRAVALGQELRLLQENFARSFRDRVFIVGNRVVSIDNGKFTVRGAEVIA